MEFCKVYHEIKAPTNRQYGKPEITGKVVFTPDLQKGEVWTDNGVVVPALPITCDVIDGTMYDRNGEHPSRYVNLMAGGPDANPNTMHWRVSYHDMRVGGEHFYIEPFIFKAIPYVKLNLAHVTPVAGYTPPGVIRGATGSPGVGIIFKGVVLTREDLPVDGVEDNHAYAISTTKDLAVWQGDEWSFIPNFANFDVNLEDISDWHYEARSNAEFTREQREETERLRDLAEKYTEAARDSVELGRSYMRKMDDNVSASITAAERAETLASQAAAAAAEATSILDALNPLRDDVDAARADVARLHEEASQFTEQAAEHVRLASQHAADAVVSASSASNHAAEGKQYAADALAEAGNAYEFAEDGKQYAADALAEANKASGFVGQASTHAETARGHAADAKSHMEEGARQAGLAAGSATSALQNANRAQQIMDDADEVLSQVQGYSQDAKNALAAAEAILGNVDGSGKSLGDVLLEVANKHQQVLGAHDDILDLHTEVLQKHGEAINYVAVAAAQAGTAAMHASMAAQEALDVAHNAAKAAEAAADAADTAGAVAEAALKTGEDAAAAASAASDAAAFATKVGEDAAKAASSASDAAADAAKAAGSAGKAADEAVDAAENNRQAIGKLEEADGKLQEADQKLQEQIDVLEDSQTVLAEAVSLLSEATDQASTAARHASQAADAAGEAAGSSLDAVAALTDAVDARDATLQAFADTQNAINTMQDDFMTDLADQQLQMKNELAQLTAGSTTRVIATAGGSSHPNYPVIPRPNNQWGLFLSGTSGLVILVDWWKISGVNRTNQLSKQAFPTTNNFVLEAAPDEIMVAEWAPIPGIVKSINETWTGTLSLGSANTWYRSTATPEILIGSSGTADFDMSVSIRWRAAWGWYRTQIRAGNVVLADVTVRGSSTIFQTIAKTATLHVSRATIPPNTKVEVWSQRWDNSPLGGHYEYDRLVTRASWTEK